VDFSEARDLFEKGYPSDGDGTPLGWWRLRFANATKFSRSPNCSSRINKASHLEHVAPIINFSIYSVELELHDSKV
jgi:hypothetical protein